MNDSGDIDGDGRFDAGDLSIMEDDGGTRRPINNNGGCCVDLVVLGSVLSGAGWWGVTKYLIS